MVMVVGEVEGELWSEGSEGSEGGMSVMVG